MRLKLLCTGLIIISQFGLVRANPGDSLRTLLHLQVPNDLLRRAELESALGHHFADQYQYDSAVACFDRSIRLCELSGNDRRTFKAVVNLGYTYYTMYAYSKALESYHRSLAIAEELDDDSLRAVAYDWISLQYLYSGAYGQAISNQLASIRIREERRDSAGLAESFYSMGDILNHQKKLDESNAYFRRCIRLASRFNQENLLVGAYGTIGSAYIDQGSWDSAFWYNRVALRIAIRNEMDYGKAFANGALGECYRAKGRLDSARICYERSLHFALPMQEYNEIANSLIGLGSLEQQEGQFDEANRHFREGLQLALEYELHDLEEEAYRNIAETFRLAGMPDSAIAYLNALLDLKNDLFEKQSQSMISTLEARYDILQQEAEQQALLFRKDRQIKKLTLAVAFGGVLFMLGFVWFTYKGTRHQRNLNTMLESHNQLMEEQNLKLSNANEDLRQFAYAASHDLKQPLRTIGNFSSLIERKFKAYSDEDSSDYFLYIQRAVRDMSSLLTNLLQYTELENKTDAFETLDMNDILATVTNNLIQLIQEKNANVMSEYLPELRANREQMIQLFQNLINNALKFNDKPCPEVIISYVRIGSNYRFAIRDNGIGIDQAYCDKIFGLFQRVGDREMYEGSGMGLAITKRIVRQYHGNIWVESAVDRGSTFYFTLPVLE